jgi:SAM-dependent methyltransferase
MRFIRALRVLHHTFHTYPVTQRAHILGRFLSAPFLRMLREIPKGSRVLDIGAGHGLYARLLVEDGAREVVAVEPDLRKALVSYRHPNVRFVCGFDECIRGWFDVVVIADVVYRLSEAERDELFRRIRARLRPGGLFVLKEIDPAARLKWQWNRFQESISDRLLGLTLGEGLHIHTREDVMKSLASAGFAEVKWRRIDRGYPHGHIVYVAAGAPSHDVSSALETSDT